MTKKRIASAVVIVLTALGLMRPERGRAAGPGLNGPIAYVDGGDIWVMEADGTNRRNLTNSLEEETDPAWSGDGRYLAFTRAVYPPGPWPDLDVWVMNADGSGQVNRTPGAVDAITGRPARDEEPTWSPLANHIAFLSNRDTFSVPEIFRMDADGTGVVKLQEGIMGMLFHPAWSPKGD